ncbi:zinc finger protein-domain-containing protein [Exophiala viscosa]|uniref:Zinc finger protein-domain-containing protein n=1 Tax=Exophiala viscosa TaxID=2486360 RepID=A0AAN6DWW4_9EURO|nr:zinc finger protein-domain-containing protein [Exophiala viscosa]
MTSPIQQECTSTKFREIGHDNCGSVRAAEGSTIAMKREDGCKWRSLLNDYNMHRLVLKTALQERLSVCAPRWPKFIKNDDQNWWDMNLARFRTGYTACNVLCSERIPPLPQDVRDRLIDRYCPPASIATIKAEESNRDCLVRPYLGRRKFQIEARTAPILHRFSMRNYPLHLNKAEDLQLPILEYAHAMAETLAMMHWVANIDANDIEFVLGAVPTQKEIAHNVYSHEIFGIHALWVLDFDCCKPLTMDDAGIEQAAEAFMRNDPYFPRPTINEQSPDNTLWIEFRDRYLECSHEPVTGFGGNFLSLPEKFIERVVEKIHERHQRAHRESLLAVEV